MVRQLVMEAGGGMDGEERPVGRVDPNLSTDLSEEN